MTRRTPSAPPRIDGLTFHSAIGSGGFADVHLYTEDVLGRQVAVKVLAAVPTPAERAAFDGEANVMAQLSSHPAIVPIYAVGVAADGRPYMTMEYCSGEPLSARYRRAPLGVPEVLELGVTICGAVETAHRAGVLHRDIKPANILTAAYGGPRLTDFGIAHLLAGGGESVTGFSVPWSPPEMFGESADADRRTDVWALAATLHTLLAGRTPFEMPGAPNDTATLMTRIETAPPAPLDSPGIPASLRRLLESGMSKSLDRRPPTAMALARSLQEIQIELRLATTRIDVMDASPSLEAPVDDDERTSVRPITVIVPEAAPVARTQSGMIGVPTFEERTALQPPRRAVEEPRTGLPTPLEETRRPARPAADPTRPSGAADAHNPPADPSATHPAATEAAAGQPASGLGRLLLVAAVLVALVGVGVVVLFGGEDDETAQDDVSRLDTGTAALPAGGSAVDLAPPPPPRRVEGRMDGPDAAVFTWRAPGSEPGDTYRWTFAGDGGETYYTVVETTSARVEIPPGRRACIVVATVRAGQQSTPSGLTCAGER